jgi:hypothetical protein
MLGFSGQRNFEAGSDAPKLEQFLPQRHSSRKFSRIHRRQPDKGKTAGNNDVAQLPGVQSSLIPPISPTDT